MNISRRLWIGPLVFLLALSAVFTSFGDDMVSSGNISLEITYGYGNYAKGGRYIPIEVSFTNSENREFQGLLRILTMESDYDVYRHDFPVEIPAQGMESQKLYVPVGNRIDQIFVELVDQEERQILHKRIKLNFSLEVPELFIGVLSDTPQKLTAWENVGVDYGMLRTKTIEFSTDTFPEEVIGLDMIDVLLISNFRIRDLSDKQSKVLVEWVRGGGTMILGTGMRVDDTLGRFAPELLEESYEPPKVDHVYMGLDYAQENPTDSTLEIPCVDFSLSGGNVILSDDDKAILASTVYYKGSIAVAAYDFTDINEFCKSNPSYIDFILTEVLGDAKINRLAESVYSGNFNQYWAIRNMINTGNVTRLPNLGLYVLEIAIYIFLVGVALYIFLRQRELTELYRAGVVVLSLIFTVLFYLMGNKTRFRDTFYTYAQFLETSQDTISENTYMNIRAPYNKPYTVHLAADYSIKPMTRSSYNEMGALPRFTGAENYRVAIEHQEEQTEVSLQNIPAFEPRYFQMNKVGENPERIGFYGELEVNRGAITGVITSNFKEKMENCVVLLYDKLIFLGDMEPGESKIVDDLPVLEYPRNHTYQVAAYISGENRFESADIENKTYVEAAQKTDLLEFYLNHYMPSYTPNARAVGIREKGEGGVDFIKTAMAEGHTIVSSVIPVYSSDEEVIYRPALIRQPKVIGGNYDQSTNSLYGVDPVTLEYSLGNDVRIEKLIFDYISEEFIGPINGTQLIPFTGNLYFYNHNTGMFDKKDPLKLQYESDELRPYLSPGNTITIRYAYENMAEYNWDVLLPMLNIVGRNWDVKD